MAVQIETGPGVRNGNGGAESKKEQCCGFRVGTLTKVLGLGLEGLVAESGLCG